MGRAEDRDAWTKHITKQEIQKSLARSNKYGAVKTDSHGQRFDSSREAKRYMDLAMLQAAGEISDLQRQIPFVLWITPMDLLERVSVGRWIADFTYRDKRGHKVIEDVKGVRTPVYKLKKKIVEALYGVKILET